MTAPPPKVSILIVSLLRDPSMLGRCLAALARNVPPSLAHEIIVLLQGGAEPAMIPRVTAPGIMRVLQSRVNLGFGPGCNRAAREARGELIVFLNDDAEVEPGWLEALVETADGHPQAGAVGSRILFPDGTIQEAGSVLWSDGSTVGVDRGEAATSSRHNFLRCVDYCSAASLLVRKSVFEAVGGFDERYFPAYYEDVDLCLSILRLGKWVMFQPRSTVIHHESRSSALDYRTFLMLRNRKQFVEKWASELARRQRPAPPSATAIDRAVWRARRLRRRVLLIDDRPPQREAGSGFGLLLDAIEELAPRGFAFSVIATDVCDGNLARLMDLGVDVIREPVVNVLRKPENLFDVVLVSRPYNLERHAADIRKYQPRAELVYLAEALFSRRMERQASLVPAPTQKSELLNEASRMREFETGIPLRVDRIVAVSLAEAELLRRREGGCPVHVISPLVGPPVVTRQPFAERADLLFVPGWLDGEASPNTDALHWFVDHVLRRVQRVAPGVRLRVTGADPPPSVRRRSRAEVTLLGKVGDLAAAYGSARVVVVPTRYGSGVKIKCAEALRYGVPVVATSVGSEGMGLEASDAIAITDEPDEFAERIIELYTNRERWDLRRDAISRLLASVASGAMVGWQGIFDSRRDEAVSEGSQPRGLPRAAT